MVVFEQLVKEINSFGADESLVVLIDKRLPRYSRELRKKIVVLRIQFNVVFIQIRKEIFCSEHPSDFHELVCITAAMEERLLPKDHRGEHSSEGPHIQGVIVLLEIDQQFRSLEVSRRNTNVVLCSLVVKFGQTPVDKSELCTNKSAKWSLHRVSRLSYLPTLVVDHNIMRLDVSVHYALRMAEIERLQQLENIESHIVIEKARIEGPEVGVIHILKHQTRGFALTVANDVEQGHNVRSTSQILQNLDLSLNLLLFHGFQHLDNAFLVVDDVYPFENLGVFPTTWEH